jgi:2-oxoglutarate ferredoxin oxidoreductase subunit alpha
VAGLTEYKRYALTPDGVSPRALPGSGPQAVYFATSDMHNEAGHIVEFADVTEQKLEKLQRKQEGARSEMRGPLHYGPEQADLTFVTWGSSYGPVRESVDLLNAQGRSANLLVFVDLWPFPVEAARAALAGRKRLVAVEGNITGQFAFMLHAHTGIACHDHILRYDGRGFTPDYILAHLEGR